MQQQNQYQYGLQHLGLQQYGLQHHGLQQQANQQQANQQQANQQHAVQYHTHNRQDSFNSPSLTDVSGIPEPDGIPPFQQIENYPNDLYSQPHPPVQEGFAFFPGQFDSPDLDNQTLYQTQQTFVHGDGLGGSVYTSTNNASQQPGFAVFTNSYNTPPASMTTEPSGPRQRNQYPSPGIVQIHTPYHFQPSLRSPFRGFTAQNSVNQQTYQEASRKTHHWPKMADSSVDMEEGSEYTSQPELGAEETLHGPWSGIISTYEDAETQMLRHGWRPNPTDTSFPTNDNQLLPFAKMIYEAMINIDHCTWKEGNPIRHAETKWVMQELVQWDIEARAWQLAKAARDLHLKGSSMFVARNCKSRKAMRDTNLSFTERIVAICDLLRTKKTTCNHVMDGEKHEVIVNAPRKFAQRSETNAVGNERKAKQINAGKVHLGEPPSATKAVRAVTVDDTPDNKTNAEPKTERQTRRSSKRADGTGIIPREGQLTDLRGRPLPKRLTESSEIDQVSRRASRVDLRGGNKTPRTRSPSELPAAKRPRRAQN